MRSRWQLLLAALWTALSCRAATPDSSSASSVGAASDEIVLLMGEELRAAREEGASDPRLGLVGVGIPGDSLSGVVSLPDDECTLVLARGAAGVQDVDVFAFADDGTVLASDESPARRATLMLCPPQPARAFISGRLAAGFGLFAVSVQSVALKHVDKVATRLGVLPNRSPESREIDGGWPGLEERLAEHRRSLGGEWESLRKVALPLDPRTYASISTRVEADRCIDVLVTPSDDVAHLELEALEANGRWIGSARARGTERNLMLCSSETRDLTLRCRPHAGRGLAALVISRSSLGASSQLGFHSARFDLRPVAPLAEQRTGHGRRLASLGYGSAVLERQGHLEVERRSSSLLPLGRGCSRIDVLTAAPMSSIRAWLWNAGGRLLAEDWRSSGATLFACGERTSARLDLETVARGGDFLVQVRQTAALPEAASQEPLAASRLLGLLDARGLLESLERLPELRTARVSESELARFDLRLQAGRCLEIGAALGAGASGLEVRLFDANAPGDEAGATHDAALGYGTRSATARVCAVKPSRDRALTAELRANVGRGTALWTARDFELEERPAEARQR